MNLWHAFTSLFIPQIRTRPLSSRFEGEPEQARKERPLPSYTQTRWMQSDVESAVVLADQGDIAMAARLARAMHRDGTFAGIMSTRAGGLVRLPKIFRGTPDVLRAFEPLDGVSLFDRIFPPKELELLDDDGINLGVGVGELLWIPGVQTPIFVRLEPEFLRYRWSEDRWYYLSDAGELPITPGDGRWILHCPGGYQAPWASGLWPSLGRSFVAKEHAYLYRENYSGKLANPARVAITPAGVGDEQKKNFFQRLMAWGLNTVFALPPGWDIKLLESNGIGYQVFKDTIEASDREFMVGLAGQVVTITGGTGFANAGIHATIRSDLIQGDGNALASTLNAQALRPLIGMLFGGASRGIVAWDTRPPGDLKAQAEAISAAAKAITDTNAALAPYGMQINAREIATRFAIPIAALAPQRAVPELVAGEEPESPPEDTAAMDLAAKMTAHGIAQCEHGRSNRCPLCGIERVRDFEAGEDGHTWTIAWRPIVPRLSIVRDAA